MEAQRETPREEGDKKERPLDYTEHPEETPLLFNITFTTLTLPTLTRAMLTLGLVLLLSASVFSESVSCFTENISDKV